MKCTIAAIVNFDNGQEIVPKDQSFDLKADLHEYIRTLLNFPSVSSVVLTITKEPTS